MPRTPSSAGISERAGLNESASFADVPDIPTDLRCLDNAVGFVEADIAYLILGKANLSPPATPLLASALLILRASRGSVLPEKCATEARAITAIDVVALWFFRDFKIATALRVKPLPRLTYI